MAFRVPKKSKDAKKSPAAKKDGQNGRDKSGRKKLDKRKAANFHAPMEVHRVAMDDIIVLKSRPKPKDKEVNLIIAGLSDVGQLEPITLWRSDGSLEGIVAGKLILEAGGTRHAAAIELGWTHIDAVINEGNVTDFRMREKSENLHRKRPTVLDRAELLISYERLRWERAGEVASERESNLVKDAKALGVTREELRRMRRIAGMPDEVKAAARKAGLAGNQAKLIEIAEQPANEQLEKIREFEAAAEKPRPKRRKAKGQDDDDNDDEAEGATEKPRPKRRKAKRKDDNDNDNDDSSLVSDDDMEDKDDNDDAGSSPASDDCAHRLIATTDSD